MQRLWVDGNNIENLDGLQTLENLSELNLAMNNIDTLGVHLDCLESLKELNLASNRLGSFREILNLNRLPKLEILHLADPNYGDNPICYLCNYQTYVLFHLPTLNRLDQKIVTEDEKTFSESTFMKKRMYYNMRIKTLQRNTTSLVGVLKVCKKLRIKKLEILTDRLTRKLVEVDREIEERQHYLAEKAGFDHVYTFGVGQARENPLDRIPLDELISDIEQKRNLIVQKLKQRE